MFPFLSIFWLFSSLYFSLNDFQLNVYNNLLSYLLFYGFRSLLIGLVVTFFSLISSVHYSAVVFKFVFFLIASTSWFFTFLLPLFSVTLVSLYYFLRISIFLICIHFLYSELVYYALHVRFHPF